jgi:hypothetical protein
MQQIDLHNDAKIACAKHRVPEEMIVPTAVFIEQRDKVLREIYQTGKYTQQQIASFFCFDSHNTIAKAINRPIVKRKRA